MCRTDRQTLLLLGLLPDPIFPLTQDYKQYSSGRFSGVKPGCDPASLARAAREAEMRARDKFCPECGVQAGIIMGCENYPVNS